MGDIRVSSKVAAHELHMDVITLRELMKKDRLPIGYALRREGKQKYHFYIYRHLLDEHKKHLGIG